MPVSIRSCPARATLIAATFVSAISAAPALAQAESQQRYVSASALNVRAVPEPSAQVLGVLKINTRVAILRTLTVSDCKGANAADCGPPGGWCVIETLRGDKELRGYVACNFLSPVASSQWSLERSLVGLWGENGERLGALTPAERAQAFDLIERMIALSPSPTSLQRYADLLDALYPGWNDATGSGNASDPERTKRIATYRAMRRILAHDTTAELAAAGPGDTFYNAHADGGRIPGHGTAQAKSLFGRDIEVVAWAGGYTVQRERGNRNIAEGVNYFLSIDRDSNIRPLFHLARAMGAAPSVQAYKVPDNSPVGMSPDGPQLPATALEASIKAHAITPAGLRAATVLKVYDQGGACNDVPSGVEFGLRRPEDQILAVFVTSKGLDASRARVKRSERRYRASPYTLTHAILYEVDLDRDGVPDLRGGVTQDQETAPNEPTPKEYSDKMSQLDLEILALALPRRWHMLRTAGWYADDITWVEANIGGVWKILSVYNVVTCT